MIVVEMAMERLEDAKATDEEAFTYDWNFQTYDGFAMRWHSLSATRRLCGSRWIGPWAARAELD